MKRLLDRAFAFVAALLTVVLPAHATWSIVVLDRRTGEMAVATSTCLSGFDISRFVPVIRVDYGAGAAQSFVNFAATNRRRIFQNLPREGATPAALLAYVESLDSGYQTRQFGLVSIWGPPATHTGTQNLATALGVTGFDGDLEYAIQGNILTGANVILDCEAAFLSAPGDLGQRILAAMEAARDAGGDGRCSCSQSAPTSCGSPPANFTFASYNVFMALVRPGDVDGVCTAAMGCANGDYYARFNYAGNPNTTEPIAELRSRYTAWRQALVDRPDALLSTAEVASPLLQADGLTRTSVRVRLVDVDGVPLAAGGQAFGVARTAGPEVALVQNVVDNGDGTYDFDLVATQIVGEATFAVNVDDGVRPVRLSPALRIASVAPRPFHVGRASVDGADPGPIEMTVALGAAAAGEPYRIFGSFSGTSPGTLVGPTLVPLVRDRLFDLTATWSGARPFVGNAGLLDGTGRATGTLDLPLGSLAALTGSTLSFAALAGSGQVTNVAELVVE